MLLKLREVRVLTMGAARAVPAKRATMEVKRADVNFIVPSTRYYSCSFTVLVVLWMVRWALGRKR